MNFFISLLFTLSIPLSSAQHAGHKVKDEENRVPIDVPIEQQGRIGMTTAPVVQKDVEHTIRTVGFVTADETTEAHIHTRINGWIEEIHADYVGKQVKKGDVLFDLYAPELVSTQEEYLAARRQGRVGKEVAKTALERLKLWEVPKEEIDRLIKTGKAKRTIPFISPIDAYIVSKNAIQGMYITPALELYYLADLSDVWIIATLYEYDLAVIKEGDEATVNLPYDAKAQFKGKISYIYPEVEKETRTAKARIIIPNPKLALKPGMYTNIEIKKDLGKAMVVPEDSVIDTGVRRIVFVKTDKTRFEPREIKVGPRVGNEFVVLSGLKENETIVTSAHFLIDAESKFRAAIQKGAPAGGHSGHGSKEEQ